MGRNTTGPSSRGAPGELRCTAVECYRRRQTTDDDDRRKRAKQYWPLYNLCRRASNKMKIWHQKADYNHAERGVGQLIGLRLYKYSKSSLGTNNWWKISAAAGEWNEIDIASCARESDKFTFK